MKPFSPKVTVQEKLASNSTIIQGETYAIYKALQSINYIQNHNYIIFSDCKVAVHRLKTIADGYLENKIITFLESHPNVFIKWIPSHSHIWPNERADNLAKSAIQSDSNVLNLGMNIKCEIKSWLRKQSIIIWQDLWNESNKGRFTHSFFNTVSVNSISDKPKYNRIISGHFPVAYYLHRFNLKEDNDCFNCGLEETIEHMIFECDLYNDIRRKNTGTNSIIYNVDLINEIIIKRTNELLLRE